MDDKLEDWLDKLQIEREQNINQAKANLCDYLAEKYPDIARISATYNGYGDEGYVDNVDYYRDAVGEPIDLKDEKLTDLVDHLFYYVTPDGFENNEGGDGEIQIYPHEKKVVVNHNTNVIHQEHESYEV